VGRPRVVFGRFVQYQSAWRRLAKFAVLLVLLIVLVENTGRLVAYAILGVILAAGASIHVVVLSKLGINGWTGEPREKSEALLRDFAINGEMRVVLKLARDLRPRRQQRV
jgi:hypothetical protein